MVSTRQMTSGDSAAHSSASSGTNGGAAPPEPPRPQVGLLELPVECLENVLARLKYKTVAHMRMVCRQLNSACGSYLNSCFQRLVSQTFNKFQAIKSKMPRRESARRNHTLACEFDVIETVHMRLSLLQMTFGKHIERKYCCFFPGEILDEVDNILEYLRVTTKLARPFKLTDELFDLSTMAMEFFKEHMEPNLPEITYFGTEFFDLTGTFSPSDGNKSYLCLDSPQPSGSNGADGGSGEAGGSSSRYEEDYFAPSPPPPQSNMVLRKRIHRIKQGMKRYNNQLSALRSDLRGCKRKSAWQQKQIAEQQRTMAEQQKQTLEYASRLDEHDKKNEETSRKIQTLLQELNKCRTELQYWRSKSPAAAAPAVCADCGYSMVSNVVPQLTLDPDHDDVFAVSPPSPLPAVDASPPLDNPPSTSRMPGSPKARKANWSGSSDEGGSSCKRANSDDASSSPQDRKKRRINRAPKPRKH